MVDTIQSYKVLDVEPGASAERVRKAYIELSRTWDPSRYVNNPPLRAQAEIKYREIEEAYKSIRAFLPGLQEAEDTSKKSQRMMRDFKELATGTQPLSTRPVVCVLLIVVIGILAYSAYFLYQRGLRFTPPPAQAPAVSLE